MATQLNIEHNQLRLRLANARLTEQLEQLEQQKSDLFQQGVNQPSQRMQTILARQIRDLDLRAAGIERTLQIIHKQSMILAHLIYASENKDRLNEGLLAQLDWNSLLEAVALNAAMYDAEMQRLDEVLAILEMPSVRRASPTPAQRPTPKPTYRVTHIPDGDGLELEDGTRVRYIGIDAPEISGWDGVPEEYAEDAKTLNASLVLGKRVRLESDTTDMDRYGRLLRNVYVGETFINAEIVRAGMARAFELWPDIKHAALMLDLETQARKARRGMWKTA